jgi:hypothetical protein
MNETDQNFDRLKQLLRLKRQEVPPPGYFNNFSSQVIARIRAAEAAHHRETDVTWFVNFLRIFETRPGLVGGFAMSLCLLLVLGVIFAEHSDSSGPNELTISQPSIQPANTLASLSAPALAPASGGIMVSTNPVASLQPAATLFGQSGAASLFQPASFAPAGQ